MSSGTTLTSFHPAVRGWFEAAFEAPTPVQEQAWQAIGQGGHVLIAAPTGSGKTLAAFLRAIDALVRRSREAPLDDRVQVLYVSPLKALSNDIERNLREPLAGIEALLQQAAEGATGIRAMVRTGDTPPGEREAMRRRPPHILVTTPESLYLLLTSASGRAMLSGVGTVIVDEIHAVAGSKRGSHLALSLARLDALCEQSPTRVGLSATQKPIERIADFLAGGRPCAVVDTGHRRHWDLALELPASPLTPVMSNEVWTEIYDRLATLVDAHHTTLVFVNTRRLAERVARHLAERIGDEAVTAHHGSLSRRHRLAAEQALKTGKLRVLVATASLELGIDIGHVDLVCQLGSTGSIAALLQRVGRSGHRVGDTPKGRLFPLSRDDLVEAVALLEAAEAGRLDAISIPRAPLDVLAQQIVAETSAREWETDALLGVVRNAWPYRDFAREDFDRVLAMLAEGYATRRGRRSAWIYHDRVNGRVRARRGARLNALQNGGTIPDQFDYEVTMLPEGLRVGTLNEDFAFESIPGDIFQLGNTSYRILKVEANRVLVEDARGQPPTIPFWFGERPGRSDELSRVVSALRERVQEQLETRGPAATVDDLVTRAIDRPAAQQLVAYLDGGREALGDLPTRERVVMERFFDDTGDMHLVIHAPFGSRVMRAWGLALRKRFCRRFNFELQAAALEDALILSLGETHSFPLDEVAGYLRSEDCREVLVQALLDAPMFGVRWRWNATTALAVQRMRNGQRLPPQWQRNQAEDLVAVVFPDQLACVENLQGAREIPDHPLVGQTIEDCLHQVMDVDGLERVLADIESGAIEVVARDLSGPSPLAQEIINARPYAFLDDGDAENRRTRAISGSPDDLADPARLRTISVEAETRVRQEAWIRPRDPDELHDGLLQLGFLTAEEAGSGNSSVGAAGDATHWPRWFAELVEDGRAVAARTGTATHWLATERAHEWLAVHPDARLKPNPPAEVLEAPPDADLALAELLRGRLALLGPVAVTQLAEDLSVSDARVGTGLARLQQEGAAVRMDGAEGQRWCDRRLLARMHRYSRGERRARAVAVPPAQYLAFLSQWHGLEHAPGDLAPALGLLEGWAAPAATWEQALLGVRCNGYASEKLDQMFLTGRLAWFRALPPGGAPRQLVQATPIAIVPREALADWAPRSMLEPGDRLEQLGAAEQRVHAALAEGGALFTADLREATGLLQPQLEDALKGLLASGLVTADAFSPLRWLLRPEAHKARVRRRRPDAELLGRWSLLRIPGLGPRVDPLQAQHRLARLCGALLRRYGVVFRAVVQREPLLPPWREVLGHLRRMEDRGEVRGGRFVDGFSGEQFALPEATRPLRRAETGTDGARLSVISAADPLNLGGIIGAAPLTPALPGNRVALRAGQAVARYASDRVEWLAQLDATQRAKVEAALRVVSPHPASRLLGRGAG